jgi:hypothetical protein
MRDEVATQCCSDCPGWLLQTSYRSGGIALHARIHHSQPRKKRFARDGV